MRLILAALACLMSLTVLPGRAHAQSCPYANDVLQQATQYVQQHPERYLHHSQVRRGMKGYGLTVFEGTKIVRFDVEIVSMMTKWGPSQDVILARLSTHNLENSGVVAGMSGSPVFVHCDDGQDRMIGAVAYGFDYQKEPLCGIQPITQMIAGSGILGPEPTTAPADGGAGGVIRSLSSERMMEMAMDERKLDFCEAVGLTGKATPVSRDTPGTPGRLVALSTPIMVGGLGGRAMQNVSAMFAPMGMVPVQAGGVGAVDLADVGDVKLVPGAAISVPMVTGDADVNAVGTVTDVIDNHVLAFGHQFFSQGRVDLPIANAYIHTVISSVVSSFKLGSGLNICGSLTRDEAVGITGQLGAAPKMIPMTVTVRWEGQNQVQTSRFQIVRHRLMTAMLAHTMVMKTAWGWHELPEFHTVRHSIEIDFGQAGVYRASNVSSNVDISAALSDMTRPIVMMETSNLGPPPRIERINVELSIESGGTQAEVLDLRLEKTTYRPGETVRGELVVLPFRKARLAMPVEFTLPSDMKDGPYVLDACDASSATAAIKTEMPQRFQPRTMGQLLDALQRVVAQRGDKLYLRLTTQRGGLAIAQNELADLPPSKASVLAEAAGVDATPYATALVREVPVNYVLHGSAQAAFEVKAAYDKTSVRGKSSQ